jgi:2-oxoglutarate dehydrogenase E2 component (dihydrolipoamide succinyltransferase)
MSQIEIKVPTVGESITEVTIGSWVKKEGDAVKRDEVICSLDSDKASFEVVSEADGILHIKAQEGEVLPIGSLICTIETVSNGVTTPPPVVAAPVPAPAPVVVPTSPVTAKVVEMKVPTVGESVTEVTIANWNKKDGDTVQLDEVLCELESDKATFELPAEAAGTLRIVAEAGSTLPIGATICRIEVGSVVSQPVAASQPVVTETVAQPAAIANYASGHPSPAAAKILAEKGMDASTVAGTGVGGRVTKEDAEKAQPSAKPAASAPQSVSTATPAAIPTPASSPKAGQRRVKMTSLRKTIARRLVAVKNETAMLTTFNEVDMKPIMDLRAKYKDKFKDKHGVGLGFMSFFTKACAVALLDFPVVNAYIDGDEIVYNDSADIAIAVSTERGLVVPVVRHTEQMSFSQIEKEIIRLAGLARENKLTIDQMTGGTFTITNGGIFGSMLSTPIINAPQSAILGMHNIVERAVVVNGEIVIRPIMYVALSYDHRIIDGKDSVSFLVRVKQILEDPTRLLLEV